MDDNPSPPIPIRRDREAPTVSIPYEGGVIEGDSAAEVRKWIADMEASKARSARWPEGSEEKMAALAELFPSMREVALPWDVHRLIGWLNSGAPTSGSRQAAYFLLNVWNRDTNWKTEGVRGWKQFDVVHACGIWDEAHLRAFLAWVAAPFFP